VALDRVYTDVVSNNGLEFEGWMTDQRGTPDCMGLARRITGLTASCMNRDVASQKLYPTTV